VIKVAIIGNVRLYRDGLAIALDNRPDIAVVAAVNDHDATLTRVLDSAPDVIIVDVHSAYHIVTLLRPECPSIRVVAFAIEEDSDALVQCAEAGVSGYVTCDAALDDLVNVIHTVVREEFVCPPRIASTLLRRLAAQGQRVGDADGEESLTARERQVLGLICEGLSNKEIAQTCSISEATVKNHVHHLLTKQKLRTRTQLAARATVANTAVRRRG
jgi:two-component system nitrate/nitrite response regulator NarL